jgi:hypothetical protein
MSCPRWPSASGVNPTGGRYFLVVVLVELVLLLVSPASPFFFLLLFFVFFVVFLPAASVSLVLDWVVVLFELDEVWAEAKLANGTANTPSIINVANFFIFPPKRVWVNFVLTLPSSNIRRRTN